MTETSLLVSLPLVAALFAALAPKAAATTGLIATLGNAILAGLLAHRVGTTGAASEALGGWTAPLGIGFTADGLAALMLVMTALVGFGVSVQVAGTRPRDPRAGHQRAAFWPLWLATLGAMNALFLSADLFNLYVAFEILGLAAVGLTALSGTRTALRAAFDYLSAGLAGSLLLLLGVALAYAAVGRVDLDIVPALAASAEGRIALGLIFAGLAVKAALFPLHFWMPAAHSSAAPAASALLSALVVKAAIYVALRLSIEGGAGAETAARGAGVRGHGRDAVGRVARAAHRPSEAACRPFDRGAGRPHRAGGGPFGRRDGQHALAGGGTLDAVATRLPRRRCSSPWAGSPRSWGMTASPASTARSCAPARPSSPLPSPRSA